MEKNEKDTDKVEQKLLRTAKRIQKSRKNVKLAEKEAAEFEEIHKLLECIDSDGVEDDDCLPASELVGEQVEESVIPYSIPWPKVFNEDLLFFLFDEENICLSNFVQKDYRCQVFGENDSVDEDTFRLLVSSRAVETLLPEEGKCPLVSAYVLYLMSVHEDPDFAAACFDFLQYRPFRIRVEDIAVVLLNYGVAEVRDSCVLDEERLLRKFRRVDGNIDKIPKKTSFPVYNAEMVCRILIDFVTRDLFDFTGEVKSLIGILGRVTLDEKIRSGYLSPLFSTLLTILCRKGSEKGLELTEIADSLDVRSENPILRAEICRSICRFVHPDLHDVLVLRTVYDILGCEDSSPRFPIKIEEIKLILQMCKKKKDLGPLEFYSLLQLITSSLPGITATVEDTSEINILLSQLERRISRTEDSVDLIRLKRELVKARNLVANHTVDRFNACNAYLADSSVGGDSDRVVRFP